MALYDLVTLRIALTDNINADAAIDELIMLRNRIANIKLQVPVLPAEHISYINELIDYYDELVEQVNQPVEGLANRLALVNEQIDEVAERLFANNYELETRTGTVESIRSNRRIYVHDDVEELIKQRIHMHTNWHYPCLEIGCRDGEWTQYLVAADPLYIIDPHTEFIQSAASRFPAEYQRRLRQYPLSNHDMSALPKQQFSFVFSWGYFNYISLETLGKYLAQVYELLRDGGTFMFSYNDGDTPAGAGMAENFAQTYVPKSKLTAMAEGLGFKVLAGFQPTTNISWIELQRPGQLTTVKAHQVMGKIKLNNS